jgi:hypothetical protein
MGLYQKNLPHNDILEYKYCHMYSNFYTISRY